MLRRDFLKLLSTIALYSPLASANKKNLKKITVVGAGIVGTCIAHELSRLGQNVTIIDKSLPGSGTSGKSFNWVNATYPKRPYSYNYLSQLGIAAFDDLYRYIDFPSKWNGSLEWFVEPNKHKKLLNNVNKLSNYPTYSKYKIIDSLKASSYEPNINFNNNNNIVYSVEDGAIDALKTIENLVARTIFNGGKIRNNCIYKNSIYRNGKLSSISTSLGEIETDLIIFATGINTNLLINKKVLKEPTPGIIIKTKPYMKVINKIIVGPGIHIHQQNDGRLVIGEQDGAPENHKIRLEGYPSKFPSSIIAKQHINKILYKAKSFIKNIDDVEVESVEIGWRPLPLDGLPIVGFIDSKKDTYVASMHSGISLGPIVGKIVAHEITENIYNNLLKEFRPSRF
ncbi:FAD-binding oxidoreductase [Gammaproteobacteria bacterium]|jgi:glycine/D-amino acid oxidase-like deaminating enzyme|nr:FAD-binding oxidoreductase [Gammaproteobacteria bacterium]MDA9903026.1 FAD-binding oxidoreductase [Gammaproteobacteria bacterium]MDC0401935.1 FAD-binding oxidoreductase [Gammaproteobacteria bacterium]